MRDYTDDLAGVENSLRRIVERIGIDKYGASWLQNLGVKEKTIRAWEKSREREQHRRSGGLAEDRLIYFSDFFDIETIIRDNWVLFEPVFLDQDQTLVYLSKLRELRNPDAHRRELTESEKALVTGIAGELRTRITRYLSQRDTPDEFFPRIDAMKDSLGNSHGKGPRPVIRVGDVIEFIVEGWDPEGAQLEYEWSVSPGDEMSRQDWSPNERFLWEVRPVHIANPTWVNVNMRGPRQPHAEGQRDAGWSIAYTVLPER